MDDEDMMTKEEEACQFMKHVLSKIAAIESGIWISMCSNAQIYGGSPSFSWRFIYGTEDGVYQNIAACVADFHGQVKWAMHKGSALRSRFRHNHTIEPEFITTLFQTCGRLKMAEILKSDYREEVQKALDDVIPLAKHIEENLGVVGAKPIPHTTQKRMIWTREDVWDNYLMAYVLSKIASVVSPNLCMFSKEYVYDGPPTYSWRYAKKTDESIYQKIAICVASFQGQVKWTMYKGGTDGDRIRNYVIEPEFLREAVEQHGYDNLPEFLESEYNEDVRKAVEDVVPLAEHIEKALGVADTDPIPRTSAEYDI